MIEPFIQRLEGALDLGEIEKPAGVGFDFALAKQLNAKAMAVQAGTFVARWRVRQLMRGLESELAGQANEC